MFETDLTGQPILVDELDADWLLVLLAEKETAAREAERGKLRLAAQWCVLHPATADTGVATWGDTGLPGMRDHDESLGGEGTPLVAAFAPEPFAAALGVSTMTGMQLLADALDLQHRHARIWSRMEALEVAPWKARKVAQAAHGLSKAAAAYVDAELADRLDSCGAVLIERVVAQAIARFHPELLRQREKRGKDGWDVKLRHPGAGDFAGTSWLEATGDAMDLSRFYELVCDQAAALAALGDTDSLGARKAKALGVIADHQSQLDLVVMTGQQADADDSNGAREQGGAEGPSGSEASSVSVPVGPTRRSAKTTLYLHLSLADLIADPGATTGDRSHGVLAIGDVEKLGPATIARIKEWVGHSRVSIHPVLDLARIDAVDEHDPPEWMRELVILRDHHCVFPWCSRDARACDLDHVEPYEEDGPPGQTRPENLAPLCRRHHRCKTSGRWRYRRRADGSYEWTGPHGRGYLVTLIDTIPISTN
jgi:hypothetical protein